MSVTLSRAYGGFASGAIVNFPDDIESALIAQGYATAASGQPVGSFPAKTLNAWQPAVVGGNAVLAPVSGIAAPTTPQGPRILPNVPIGAFASLGTSAVHVAGTWYRAEIYVPHFAQWTGIGVLNGATVGTDNIMVGLWDSNGILISNSAVAGALSAGANAFQNIALLNAPVLVPGRYFIGVQCNGTTATTRRQAAVMGGNTMTSSTAGTFGVVPSSFTPPTTFTADVGPIAWLYQ